MVETSDVLSARSSIMMFTTDTSEHIAVLKEGIGEGGR